MEKSLNYGILFTLICNLLQIHWPDCYVALFGDFFYDPIKWRECMPLDEQLRAFQKLIEEGKAPERGRITAWENLQNAKADTSIRKLEMKLEKKKSESMDKIMNKLKIAQIKAQ